MSHVATQHSVTLSLSNTDINALIADALEDNVLYTPGVEVTVTRLEKGDGRWHVTYVLGEIE